MDVPIQSLHKVSQVKIAHQLFRATVSQNSQLLYGRNSLTSGSIHTSPTSLLYVWKQVLLHTKHFFLHVNSIHGGIFPCQHHQYSTAWATVDHLHASAYGHESHAYLTTTVGSPVIPLLLNTNSLCHRDTTHYL